jgi:manganese oxidase
MAIETSTEVERPKDGLTVIALCAAVFAVVAAVIGVGFGMRAIDESESVSSGGDAEGASAPVSLAEFSVSPALVPAGGSLHVTNDGSVAHNLAIEGTDVTSADLEGGASEHLELGEVDPGTYTMFCSIPGHREAGMEAQLEVTEGGAAPLAAPDGATDHAATAHASGDMDYEAMTEAMTASMAEFPAETEGLGNPVLEPANVRPDGTKVFELTAEIVDWERAPGDVVEAWTYNGVVPAPSIHLEVGDRAVFRVQNELPIATDLHLHGLNVENQFDGVAPITQDVIEPGASFDYEYTADEVAVAMFHPHFHSQIGMPNGMFGTIFVGDVPLPQGNVGDEVIPPGVEVSQEIPMVLNDSGVIGFSLNGKSFPATAPVVAQTGDWIEIHYFNEGGQAHPMHLHEFDQIVIAKDGFALDEPYVADTINVAPGERYTVLVQLDEPGTWVWHCHILPHVEDDQGMFGMVTAVVVE